MPLRPMAARTFVYLREGLRILLKHLLYGFAHYLLVLVSIVAQRVLSYSAPHQLLLIRVVEVDDQSSFDILFGRNSAHTSPESAHAPGAPGGLLLQSAADNKNQVGILRFLHLGQAFSLKSICDIGLRRLRED